MTPVIFKQDGPGAVCAIFPTTYDARTGQLDVYAHVGQHGLGDITWARQAKRPTAEQAEQVVRLKRELVEIGYSDLEVYSRIQGWMLKTG